MLEKFTRGGQTTLHKIHMTQQVFMRTLFVSLAIGLAVSATKSWYEINSYQWYLFRSYVWAELMVDMPGDINERRQEFMYQDGSKIVERCVDILSSPSIKKSVSKTIDKLFSNSFLGGLISLGLIIFASLFWWWWGFKAKQKVHERGGILVSSKKLAQIIQKKKMASDLKVGNLPLLKDKETAHILITGTTGSGKSNCLHELLPQIRNRSDQAIILDLNGDFISRYYKKGVDKILNPFDTRSEPWNIWAECQSLAHYDMFASAMIPQQQFVNDRFWDNAGKALLATALEKLKAENKLSTQELHRLLVTSDLAEMEEFFAGTEAASFTSVEGEKMTLSIRANLATQLRVLKHLEDTDTPFSIRKWIYQSERINEWLFLTCRPDQRETLKPLLTAWMDTAINALMSKAPNSKKRLWFILDELAALQKIPSLQIALAESRKYGGCVVAGIQSVPQLSEIYGHTGAQALPDLFNTKICFRNTDPETVRWASQVLGEVEETESVENLSYGANSIRDGVSLNKQTRTKPLVLPTEVSMLKDLEAYVKFSQGLPITKIQMKYQERPQVTEAFLLKEEKLIGQNILSKKPINCKVKENYESSSLIFFD